MKKQMHMHMQIRRISTFHIDNTPKGKLGPYLGVLKMASAVAGTVVVSVGAGYLMMSQYIEKKWPSPPEAKRAETRRLLRGAAMREHIAPDPRIAYLFLLRALEQIYQDGAPEDSPGVQELVVRLARAAEGMGEFKPAIQMLQQGLERIKETGLWEDRQRVRIARALGPLLVREKNYEEAMQVYKGALQAINRLEIAQQGADLLVEKANCITSFAELLALKGDLEPASILLSSVLVDIRKQQTAKVDDWTCLDSVVMLNLAQVANQQGSRQRSRDWAMTALKTTAHRGVRACDNCKTHLIQHLAEMELAAGKPEEALRLFRQALEHGRKTGTGDLEEIKQKVLLAKE